jgi:hypothetical protein
MSKEPLTMLPGTGFWQFSSNLAFSLASNRGPLPSSLIAFFAYHLMAKQSYFIRLQLGFHKAVLSLSDMKVLESYQRIRGLQESRYISLQDGQEQYLTVLGLGTLRISQETSTVHKAGYSVEQNNTQLNLAIVRLCARSARESLHVSNRVIWRARDWVSDRVQVLFYSR